MKASSSDSRPLVEASPRSPWTRRRWLQGATVASLGWGAISAAPQAAHATVTPGAAESVRFCLNTSTIREQKLSLVEEIELAARVGYDGIEPWIREIQVYQQAGGSLRDLRSRLDDLGLRVESAIGFANWLADDPDQRAAGLEAARADMELVRAIGGTRIAAPPVGATDRTDLALGVIAERYAALLEVGADVGVTPQLELWGFSKTLSRLGELAYVASEANHPLACVLPDVYHIYKGGSGFEGLRLFAGQAMHAFHINDYPAEPPRDRIGDSDRVFPGDGVAPLEMILGILLDNGFCGALSLELFNPQYWQRDAEEVAAEGLSKMRKVVARVQTQRAPRP